MVNCVQCLSLPVSSHFVFYVLSTPPLSILSRPHLHHNLDFSCFNSMVNFLMYWSLTSGALRVTKLNCPDAKFNMISSLPPGIAYALTSLYIRSTRTPLPPLVYPAPPKTCIAFEAQNSAVRDDASLSMAMCPPKFTFCSDFYIVFIWNVMFSNHACRASTFVAISPILC